MTSGMLCTAVLPMFHTLIPESAYRRLIWMKPSAVRRSRGAATLTYPAPICLRKSSCSSVGLAGDWAQSLIRAPGVFAWDETDLSAAGPKNPAAPSVLVSATLPKSLRCGSNGTPEDLCFCSRCFTAPSPFPLHRFALRIAMSRALLMITTNGCRSCKLGDVVPVLEKTRVEASSSGMASS